MNSYLNSPVVFIDDECIFCNFWGNFIIKNDKSETIYISSANSDLFKKISNKNPILPNVKETVILIYNGKHYSKSSAIIKIATIMKSWYRILIIGYLVPQEIRDKLYDFIAKRRKEIMKNDCVIGELKSRERFIT
jgi:predicted DCC family thiol-disulfide oxidoreductase YuxK